MVTKDLNRLKLVLVEKKKTGVWLSEQLGVSPVTVSKWCSNITQPTLPTLDRIAKLLECEKRELAAIKDGSAVSLKAVKEYDAELSKYYGSELWKQDFAADERQRVGDGTLGMAEKNISTVA